MYIFDYIFYRFYKKFDKPDDCPFFTACLYTTYVFVAFTQGIYLNFVSEYICPSKLEHLYYYAIFWYVFFYVLYWKRKSKVLEKFQKSKSDYTIPYGVFLAFVFPFPFAFGFFLGFLSKIFFSLI